MLKQLSDFFASHGAGTAPARAVGTLSAPVAARGQHARLYRRLLAVLLAGDGGAGFYVALITRAPPGPFTPAPFGFAKDVLRKCGVSVS